MPLTRRRALTVFFLAVVLGALALWPSAQRQGTGPAKGSCDETTCVLPDSAPLSIALMNIRRGRGLDDEKDLGRTAECLKGSQLIALNEVGGADDATELASLLSLAPLFAASERFFWQEDFGNALLSPTPPQSWERIPLPHADEGGWRNLLIARWPIGDRQLTVMITHLDRGSARTRQLAQVIELFRAAPAPKVLLGDLNSHRGEPLLAALLADPTLSVADPGEENRIDWIIGQGMTFSAVRVCDVGASDHPALLTQMIISP